MREILFRARSLTKYPSKNIAFGDFVYGSYIESGTDAPCIIFGDGEQCEIDRETLGQYTGLKDRNGTKVFEGDIVNGGGFTRESYVIEYHQNNCQFIGRCFDDKGFYYLTGTDDEYREVIGNIYENPELLK